MESEKNKSLLNGSWTFGEQNEGKLSWDFLSPTCTVSEENPLSHYIYTIEAPKWTKMITS